MKEIWKDVVGLEQYVMISNLGRVWLKGKWLGSGKTRRFKEGQFRKGSIVGAGYVQHKFTANGKRHHKKEHIMVAEAFIEKKESTSKLEVNHKDGNKLNNKASNLEWLTHKENVQHALRTGLRETKAPIDIKCLFCGKYFNTKLYNSKYCSRECTHNSNRIVARPSKEDLYGLLVEYKNFTYVASIYSVSDNTVRKWCRDYGVPSKSTYYRSL